MRALANPRFRLLLLVVAGVPITVQYVIHGLLLPLLQLGAENDLLSGYIPAARILAGGGDPYRTACTGPTCFPLLGPFSAFQPPAMLWLLQPVTHVDPRLVDAMALLAANLLVLVFIGLTLRLLEVRDRQLLALCGLLVIGWSPVMLNLLERQPELLLLVLTAAWALAHASRRFELGGGLALGVAAALKLTQGPLLLLPLLRRRWANLTGAAVGWVALWALAVPGLLPEYFAKVLPSISSGTGHGHNVALAGTLERIFQPQSLYGTVAGSAAPVRYLAAAAALLALAATVAVLPKEPERDDRLLEVAAFTAWAPLAATLVWPAHLVLELIPILILVVLGLRSRSPWPVGLALAGWVMIGLVNQAFLAMTAAPALYGPLAVHLMAESGAAGQLLVWAGALVALRQARQSRSGVHAAAASVTIQGRHAFSQDTHS